MVVALQSTTELNYISQQLPLCFVMVYLLGRIFHSGIVSVLKDEDLSQWTFERKGNLRLLKGLPSGIERHKDWSVGKFAILHSLHYNYGLGGVLADVGSIIMQIM